MQFGTLEVTNSTIMQQYLCQIPKRRSTGALVVAILSANLVFLQTVWKCFNLVTTWFVVKKDKTAMFCENAVMDRVEKGHRRDGGNGYRLVDMGSFGAASDRSLAKDTVTMFSTSTR